MSAADAPRDATPPLAFHPHRIVIDGGVLIALAGLSLSFVTTARGQRPWSLLDGVVLLGILAPLVLVTMLPDRSQPLSKVGRAIATALVLVATPYAVVKMLDAFTLARALGGAVGPGPWLVVVGVVGTIAGVVLGWVRPGESLPPPSPAIRHRAAAEVALAQTNVPVPAHEERWRSEPVDEASWLDKNPFGEPLFDSLEIEAPPADSAAGGEPPYDHDSEFPDEPSGEFDTEAEPDPGVEGADGR